MRLPVDTANDLVIDPLRMLLTPPRALPQWSSAAPGQRVKWAAAFTAALSAAAKGAPALAAAGEYGFVPALTVALLVMAAHGNLDGAQQNGEQPYSMDFTPTILLLGDGSHFQGLAATAHLTGDQWGVMKHPGLSWPWLFLLLYQVEPFKSSANADLLMVSSMPVHSLLLTLLPLIPGLRSFPPQHPHPPAYLAGLLWPAVSGALTASKTPHLLP